MNSSQLLPVIWDNIIISPLLGSKRCRPHAPGRIDDPWNRARLAARSGAPFIGRLYRRRNIFSVPAPSSRDTDCVSHRTHSHPCRVITLSSHNYFTLLLLLTKLLSYFRKWKSTRVKILRFIHLYILFYGIVL